MPKIDAEFLTESDFPKAAKIAAKAKSFVEHENVDPDYHMYMLGQHEKEWKNKYVGKVVTVPIGKYIGRAACITNYRLDTNYTPPRKFVTLAVFSLRDGEFLDSWNNREAHPTIDISFFEGLFDDA